MLKKIYHSVVPRQIRYPIGRARRRVADTALRTTSSGPLPPRGLLESIQMTGYAREYLSIGERSASTIGGKIRERLGTSGTGDLPRIRILDFGCGLSRTLRFLRGVEWELHGCDPDGRLIQWSQQAFPEIAYLKSGTVPPLPYPTAFFDFVYAVSVFTHFARAEQSIWQAELGRILRPGGCLILTTMGSHALSGFPELNTPTNRAKLEDGFLYVAGSAGTFNSNGAFHTSAGISKVFDLFELESWESGGLDGFQDLAVLRRRSPSEPSC